MFAPMFQQRKLRLRGLRKGGWTPELSLRNLEAS